MGYRLNSGAGRNHELMPAQAEITLDQLPNAVKAVVDRVVCQDAVLRNKLLAMGVVHGTELSVCHRAPTGDPITIQVFSGKLALRRSEARNVFVVPL